MSKESPLRTGRSVREETRVFGKALVEIDNADDVQKVINRTEFALQEAKKARGAVDTKALQDPQPARVIDTFLTEKYGRTAETATSVQLREALIETKEAVEGAEDLVKIVGSATRGFEISALERQPKLRGGINEGVLTDGFSMIIDRQITEDFFRKLFEKNARLAQKRFGLSETDVQNLVKADWEGARKEMFVDYKAIIPKIEGSRPAFIQGAFLPSGLRQLNVVISDGTKQAVVNADKLAFMKKNLPIAEIRLIDTEKPILFVEKGKVKGLLMPMRDTGIIPFAPTQKPTAKVPPISRVPSRVLQKVPQKQPKELAKELKTTPPLEARTQLAEQQKTIEKAHSDAVSRIEQDVSSLPKSTIRENLSQAEKQTPPPTVENTRTTQNDWRGTFELPPETKMQAIRRSVEDFNIRLKVLNDKIEEVSGEQIKENFNLWAQKDMLPRQQSDLLRRTRDKKRDFVKRLVENRIKVEELDEYLHAKHAVERNKKMEKGRSATKKSAARRNDTYETMFMEAAGDASH